MKLRIDEASDNYFCAVVKVGETFEIPKADNLNRIVLFGNNLVVSKAVKQGDIMLYFVAGTQLSEDLCYNNNLYDSSIMNIDSEVKGYISSKRRMVKAIKLRGTISDGMLLPLDALNYLEGGKYDARSLSVGDEFTHIGDVEICRKYTVPVKEGKTQQEKQPKVDKMKDVLIPNQFRLHTSTEHFARNLDKFGLDTEIIITRKMHGSSLILSHVLTNKKLNWVERLIDRFIPQVKSEYGYVFSSGKPKSKLPKGVESANTAWESPTESFYSTNIWKKAYEMNRGNLEKGISIYGEIVGKGVQGEAYTYGYDYKIFVYRITQTNPDGIVYELSWEAVKAYCEKYGMTPVQTYFTGKVSELGSSENEILEVLTLKYLDKSYPDCKVDEGVCIRIRETDEIFKLKSPKFILGESASLEQGIENES